MIATNRYFISSHYLSEITAIIGKIIAVFATNVFSVIKKLEKFQTS